MSEISVLSHEYKNAAEFSQRFNRALIQVKKHSLDLNERDATAPEEAIVYRGELALVLEGIIQLLKPEKGERSESARWIPGTLIAHLLGERRGDLDDFVGDLERLAQELRDPEGHLSAEDFELLDSLAGDADDQTSQVFRRLMRK